MVSPPPSGSSTNRAPSTEDATWRGFLFRPIDIASVVVFRICFGSFLLIEVFRYLGSDWISTYYVDPKFHFKYYGFGWVQAWPRNWMDVHFLAMGVFAACVICGLRYRVAAIFLFVSFTYVFLLDQARYLNHFYLVSLISFLMIFVPAHRARSFDAARVPNLRSEKIPAWSLWLLRTQIGIVYVYAGVAKLGGDWLSGEPMRMWLRERESRGLLGKILGQEWVPGLVSYGGLLFDILVVPFLLWPRTRAWAFFVAISFHLLNAWLFRIGIFPWFMIAATLLFFSPSWPRRLCIFFQPPEPQGSGSPLPQPAHRTLIAMFLVLYVTIQLLFPLRHFLYPGNVHWTEEGHRFSWHMKLRDKSARTRFFATDPESGETWQIETLDTLNRNQQRKMSGRPDMILQFAHHVAEELRADGYPDIEIRVQAQVSLNGRPRAPLIDPEVDLAREPRTLCPASWILPLDE